MGATLQKSHHGRKRRRIAPVIAEINMTPFIDVMLVLLIVFMVTAPLINVGVPVNLPKTSAPAINQADEPLTVTIDKDGKIFVQEAQIEEEALSAKLDLVSKQNKETKIYIKGDKTRSYGDIMHVMGLIYSAGFTKVMLMGDPQNVKQDTKLKKKP
jgi:biopolymer transport protein TolR